MLPVPPQFRAPLQSSDDSEGQGLAGGDGVVSCASEEPRCGLELNMAQRLLAINLDLCPLRGGLKVFTG